MADHFQKKFGDILYPVSEAENFAGKAYTYRPNESVKMWLRRGSLEHGENREKFRKTIFSQTRMSMKIRAGGGIAGLVGDFEPKQLAAAYESVRARAVELTHEAKLDAHSSELVLGAVQAAHATLIYGPNMAELVVHRLMVLIGSGLSVADASAEATQWAQDEIVKAKIAPDNPFGHDDEAIAASLLAKIQADEG